MEVGRSIIILLHLHRTMQLWQAWAKPKPNTEIAGNNSCPAPHTVNSASCFFHCLFSTLLKNRHLCAQPVLGGASVKVQEDLGGAPRFGQGGGHAWHAYGCSFLPYVPFYCFPFLASLGDVGALGLWRVFKTLLGAHVGTSSHLKEGERWFSPYDTAHSIYDTREVLRK